MGIFRVPKSLLAIGGQLFGKANFSEKLHLKKAQHFRRLLSRCRLSRYVLALTVPPLPGASRSFLCLRLQHPKRSTPRGVVHTTNHGAHPKWSTLRGVVQTTAGGLDHFWCTLQRLYPQCILFKGIHFPSVYTSHGYRLPKYTYLLKIYTSHGYTVPKCIYLRITSY